MFDPLRFLANLRGRGGGPGAHFTPAEWRRIEAGPVAGLQVFAHRGHGRSLGDRIAAGTYEPELTQVVARYAARGGHLYDIGAHVGFVTCAWVHLGGAGADAFEPVPSNADIVENTVRQNGLSGVRVHRIALSDAEADGAMRVNTGNLSTSSMAYLEDGGGVDDRADSLEYAGARTIVVTTRRLDSFASQHGLPAPALIKIDVEGAEGHVLRGAVGTLARHKPAVICEVHNVASAVDVSRLLTQLGYEPTLVMRQKQSICNYLWTHPASPGFSEATVDF